VLAQTLEPWGAVLPMQYDAQGGRHYYMHGYDGALAPPMPGETKSTSRIKPKPVLQTTPRIGRQSAAGTQRMRWARGGFGRRQGAQSRRQCPSARRLALVLRAAAECVL